MLSHTDHASRLGTKHLALSTYRGAIITAALITSLLTSCAATSWSLKKGDEVVYALGSRGGFPSPVERQLKPAAAAIPFPRDTFLTSDAHARTLTALISQWEAEKQRFVIAGYARPGLPPDYARVLSERRALAVRQRLIESGVDPADMQTIGLGNDFPLSGPTSDVVVVYLARE